MFKSYTRKSSAKIGAERAGKSEADLVQVDGKWGFYENDPVAENVEALKPAMVDVILNAVVNNEVIVKCDRRKVKRAMHRLLDDARKQVKKGLPREYAANILDHIRDLRQSFRKSKLNRVVAIDDLGNTRVLA